MKKFSLDTQVKMLLEDERARDIMDKFIPGCLNNSQLPLIKKMRIKNLIGKGGYVGLSPEEEISMMNQILDLED